MQPEGNAIPSGSSSAFDAEIFPSASIVSEALSSIEPCQDARLQVLPQVTISQRWLSTFVVWKAICKVEYNRHAG